MVQFLLLLLLFFNDTNITQRWILKRDVTNGKVINKHVIEYSVDNIHVKSCLIYKLFFSCRVRFVCRGSLIDILQPSFVAHMYCTHLCASCRWRRSAIQFPCRFSGETDFNPFLFTSHFFSVSSFFFFFKKILAYNKNRIIWYDFRYEYYFEFSLKEKDYKYLKKEH